MASYETIRVETDQAVATVTLDRPQKLNAMDVPLEALELARGALAG